MLIATTVSEREMTGSTSSSAREKPDSTLSARSLRVLHIITKFDPRAGGPPEGLRQLANAYAKLGVSIEVVCLDDPREAYLQGIPCPVHALGKSVLGKYSLSSRLGPWLIENAGRFDALVMHGIWTFPGVALRVAARRVGKPYGIFVHGALDPWFDQQYPLKHVKKQIYWPIQHAVLRDATAVFFTAEAERDLAKTSYKPSRWNSAVVSSGVTDPEEQAGNPEQEIESFYRHLPQLRSRRYLLFLARLHTKKGCDLLIKAFAKAANAEPSVDLVIAGPDQEGMQSNLKELAGRLGIADRVYWPGMLSRDLKWGALRASDAFILPSHSENFGTAIVESLAVGRPVLISNKVNIWREIEQDGAGFVDDNTVEGTERLLMRWFGLSPEERKAMAARARISFIDRFTMEKVALKINEVFVEAISRPASCKLID